jgi:hypothetical protein
MIPVDAVLAKLASGFVRMNKVSPDGYIISSRPELKIYRDDERVKIRFRKEEWRHICLGDLIPAS